MRKEKAWQKDIQKYWENRKEKSIEKNKEVKCLRKIERQQQLICMKDKDGTETGDTQKILEIAEEFYREIYTSKVDESPEFKANTKKGLTSDPKIELIKGEENIIKELCKLFSECL